MKLATVNPCLSLARLLIRHQLAVAYELRPMDVIETMEREIAWHLKRLDLALERPVFRCGLATAIGSRYIGIDGHNPDLIAAQVLMLELGRHDPIARFFGMDAYEETIAFHQWETVLGSSQPGSIESEALARFVPAAIVTRYQELKQASGVDPAAVALLLLDALDHESSIELTGPRFERVDMATLMEDCGSLDLES